MLSQSSCRRAVHTQSVRDLSRHAAPAREASGCSVGVMLACSKWLKMEASCPKAEPRRAHIGAWATVGANPSELRFLNVRQWIKCKQK